MKLRILGSGTSTGVPIIGCDCAVCSSGKIRNQRTRASALFTVGTKNLLVDTSIDFRAQALAVGIKHIDGVLFTHSHADHIHGIDDLRAFNFMQKSSIPCFGNAATMDRIETIFDYIFTHKEGDGWKPKLELNRVDKNFTVAGVEVTPLPVEHGRGSVMGYRIGEVAYVTDCSSIPDGTKKLLEGLELIVIGALRHEPHPTHFTIGEAIRATQELKPKRTVLTHLGHNIDYDLDGGELPGGVEFAYDGMELSI